MKKIDHEFLDSRLQKHKILKIKIGKDFGFSGYYEYILNRYGKKNMSTVQIANEINKAAGKKIITASVIGSNLRKLPIEIRIVKTTNRGSKPKKRRCECGEVIRQSVPYVELTRVCAACYRRGRLPEVA